MFHNSYPSSFSFSFSFVVFLIVFFKRCRFETTRFCFGFWVWRFRCVCFVGWNLLMLWRFRDLRFFVYFLLTYLWCRFLFEIIWLLDVDCHYGSMNLRFLILLSMCHKMKSMHVGVAENGEWSSQNVTTWFHMDDDLSVCRGAINVPLLRLFGAFVY